MNQIYHCYSSAAFGMEGLVSGELKECNMKNVKAENGGVYFDACGDEIFFCNLHMHFNDRIFVVLAENACTTFEELFQTVYGIDWKMFFSGAESIDISCKCTKSSLMSQRDCQSIAKKAIIEKVKSQTKQSFFPESGDSLSVLITIRNDRLRVLLNTSGDALSRRGYRTWNGEAPLRETLASALVRLSGWKPGKPLHDPCCGTGTILIEAAFFASGRAPGLRRSFAMEKYKCFQHVDYDTARNSAVQSFHAEGISGISGSDIDPEALKLASRHVVQSGLDSSAITLSCQPLQELQLDPSAEGSFICNPPYGERLSDQTHCRQLYGDLRKLKNRHPSWHMSVISSDPAFERYFGKRADRKRRLYNGRLECVYYCYD